MASTDLVERLQRKARDCIHQWKQKPSANCDAVVFRACMVEGKRKEGVSKQFFEHILALLSSMTCWDASEQDQPWKYTVIYETALESLEKDVTELARSKDSVKAAIFCDAKGSNAVLRLSYQDEPPLQVGIGPYATVLVALEKRSESGQYLKKDANFSKMVVEARKTFTFHEHFDWEYTLILRYREPYFATNDLMTDVEAKDLTFRDPPRCFVEIACHHLKSTDDYAYFADSFLCKISDLLPMGWRMASFHVKSPPLPPPMPPMPPKG